MVDIINNLREYDIHLVVVADWADKIVAKQEYNVDLISMADLPKADCIIVVIGHREYRNLSVMQLK